MTRRLADRYVIRHQLAVGGTSRVHEAFDERLGRPVAVKLLDADLIATADPAGRDRFLQECRTAARFAHRRAVMVFDAGEDEGDLFLVMELVPGPSLAQHLAAQGQLPVSEAVRIASQVLEVLAVAHQEGIVHRDVKPANILFTADGDVKLADFGIAKRFDELDRSLTATGLVVGTPRYLAPEQVTDGKVTPATDVYAVGILLYEMLAGRPPFVADSVEAAAVQQQTVAAPNVRSARPDVPETLAALVARALEREVAHRPPDATAFRSDLERAMSLPPGDSDVPASPSLDATRVVPATEVMPAAPAVVATAPALPHPPAVVPSPEVLALRSTARARQRRRAATVALAAVALVALGVGAIALVRGTPPPIEARGLEPVAATDDAAAGAATDDAGTAEGQPGEVVPGFPATDDPWVFLGQLEHDPARVGPAGPEVAVFLREVLEIKAPPKQAEAAAALQREIIERAERHELDPAITWVLYDLLVPLAEHPSR